LTEDFVLIAD